MTHPNSRSRPKITARLKGTSRLKRLRKEAGLTQGELAERTGVSRQLIGAVEAGRNLPRVDAAIALAAALNVDVSDLFLPESVPVDIVTGAYPEPEMPVMVGRVGDTVVTSPARLGLDGWDVADGVVAEGKLQIFEQASPGFVVAGCEPGLELLERILREHGMAGVSATASSTAAIDALTAGRVHAAVVHGPAVDNRADPSGLDVARFALARWRVGIAAPHDAPSNWVDQALSGRVAVVQREEGAGVQRAFKSCLRHDRPVPGPRVTSHFESARRGVLTSMPAVTIEPAALAVGASFHAIEIHDAQLWVDRRWIREASVAAALDVVAGLRFQRRLLAVGGYDLTGCGDQVA
jgi:DNA-binding XRE family transcriptional regulator